MICEPEQRVDQGPWGPKILLAVAEAEDALARLDERLRASPIRDGFCARAHFYDACAALWLAGELVHLEDLVLHDSDMDLRAPTHELTRAHTVLRARRRIANFPPGAFFSRALDALRGQDCHDSRQEEEQIDPLEAPLPSQDDDPLAAEFSAIDAVIARSSRLLAEGPDASPPISRAFEDPSRGLIYDPDHDEQAFFAQWRSQVEATKDLPPTLAAAVAYEAWQELSPAEHDFWLGPLLVADLLRRRGKARAHLLPCVNVGLRAVPWEVRRGKDRDARLGANLAAIKAAAEWGLAECDRLAVARARLERRCRGKRGNSRLPALADLVVAKPFVTAAMAAAELEVSPRAALDMIAALDLRELTGRGRFRAWGL